MIPPQFRAWHKERQQMYAVRTIVYDERTVILDADPRIACGFDVVVETSNEILEGREEFGVFHERERGGRRKP